VTLNFEVTTEMLEVAFKAATKGARLPSVEEVTVGIGQPGTASPSPSAARVWDAFRGAVELVHGGGPGSLRRGIQQVRRALAGARRTAGQDFGGVAGSLRQRLASFRSTLYAVAMTAFPEEIRCGENTFRPDKIVVSIGVVASSNVELSMLRLLKFVAQGEIGLEVEYATTSEDATSGSP
jgi:hypothetical protein